jgi:hypothetical protein
VVHTRGPLTEHVDIELAQLSLLSLGESRSFASCSKQVAACTEQT